MRLVRSLIPVLLFVALLVPVTARAQGAAAVTTPTNNYWFTLFGSVSQPNDSFSDLAEMGSQFLGGVHRRLGDRLTLGLTMGAGNWSGVDIQFYHDVQITLDARFHITRPNSRMRPFVQLGGGSYQVVSEAEVEGVEPERASESGWGVNYGAGVLFAVGKTARLGPVVLYNSAGKIPEIGSLVGKGDCKFISFGVELVMPMGR